jgi:deferrochelatase/peroxidase EfeB
MVESSKQVSRRAMLGFIGAGAALVAGTGTALARDGHGSGQGHGGGERDGRGPGQRDQGVASQPRSAVASIPFEGPHQQGIITPGQEHLSFAALNLTTTSRAALITLMQKWTTAARTLTAGRPVGRTGAVGGRPDAVPEDTGVGLDLPASNLTITIGFGQSLFRTGSGADRFGLAALRPAAFVDLPAFAGDRLDASISHGDLCIQACSDDQQVAHHAVRTLVRLASQVAGVRWVQAGFGKSATAPAGTPRNLFGFKDGTSNIGSEEFAAHDRWVWAQPGDGPAWINGGTYLVARRIEMTLEEWDEETLEDQEQTFGRTKGSGAPLSGGDEQTPPDFAARRVDGKPMIDPASHVALASPSNNAGLRILRRGYNFIDGADAAGKTMAGLFFVGFNRDLRTQFIPLQRKLSSMDKLNEYLRYRSSAAFAIPPGVQGGASYLGQSLLES